MIMIINTLISYMAGLCESVTLIFLMRFLLGPKYNWSGVFVLGATLEFLIFVFINFHVDDLAFSIMLYAMYYLIFGILFCNGRLHMKLLVTMTCMVILIMSDILSMSLIKTFVHIDIQSQLDPENWYNLVGTILSKTICFSAYAIIVKVSKQKQEKLGMRDWIPLISVPVSSVLTLLLIIEYIEKMADQTINAALVLAAVLASFLANILVFFFNERLKESMRTRQQLSLMRQQTDIQSRHYAEIQSSHANTRAIWHDMNNHMTVLGSLVQSGDLARVRTYMEEIGKTIHELVLPERTGNMVLDAVLNEKYRLAEQLGIRFDLQLYPIGEGLISPMDLCIIIGNALDNAIEGCRRMELGEPFILVKIDRVGENLSIVIHNSAPPSMNGQKEFKTTKKNQSSHGYGIQNIRNTLEKHDGSFDLGVEDNVFKFSAFIPV